MQLFPGDPNKATLRARGLDWEMFVEHGRILDVTTHPKYPEQIRLEMLVDGRYFEVACEPVVGGWRMVAAWESRKIRRKYL